MVHAISIKRLARDVARGLSFVPALGLCFMAPALALSFLATGPHSALSCLWWIVPMWLSPLVDRFSVKSRHHQAAALPVWVFDGTLYVLALLQIINIFLLLLLASRLSWGGPGLLADSLMNLLAVKVVVGTSSSFSAIVVAHELIHRRQLGKTLLARLLLSLTCYEHFSTEHLSGHHRRVGTREDAATARFGESFRCYWRRTLKEQFKSAWCLESERLGPGYRGVERWLRHRVLQGVVFEGLLLTAIAWYFGLVALGAFLLQALAAVHKLEAVNYIEHWGLNRQGHGGFPPRAWETDSWFTIHTLLGLPLHTDHHHYPGRPYQMLRHREESPRLPYGYFCMVFMAVWMNRRLQALLIVELQRKGLGPFAGER